MQLYNFQSLEYNGKITRTLFIPCYYESFQLNIDERFEETSLVIPFHEA
jgi:hypothetical protein